MDQTKELNDIPRNDNRAMSIISIPKFENIVRDKTVNDLRNIEEVLKMRKIMENF